MLRNTRTAARLVSASALLVSLRCGKGETTHRSSSEAGRSVVVHSSTDKGFAQLIFSAYEKKSGPHCLLRTASARVPGPTIYVAHDPVDARELSENVVILESRRLRAATVSAVFSN